MCHFCPSLSLRTSSELSANTIPYQLPRKHHITAKSLPCSATLLPCQCHGVAARHCSYLTRTSWFNKSVRLFTDLTTFWPIFYTVRLVSKIFLRVESDFFLNFLNFVPKMRFCDFFLIIYKFFCTYGFESNFQRYCGLWMFAMRCFLQSCKFWRIITR